MWSEISVSFPSWEVEMQMRVTGPGRRGAQGVVSAPYSYLLGKPVIGPRYRDPDLWAANLQTMWYTKDRDQVGSVVEGLASWDGVGIYFDSSTSGVQVGSHLPILLPACLNPNPHLLEAQTDCHLPHRMALPSECWPVMGMASRSSLGKRLRELSPSPPPLGVLGDGPIFLGSFSSRAPGEVREAGTTMRVALTPETLIKHGLLGEDIEAQKGWLARVASQQCPGRVRALATHLFLPDEVNSRPSPAGCPKWLDWFVSVSQQTSFSPSQLR